ncbi:sel1 repeat family protein [Erysipelothrix sp. HDW6A]|uniref:relaxase MobL n=1 Tax=Erysipelothrix sp. HDW6A TaxID=2714928 RepID=UPI00140929DD|nr:relaxase MobL [Erysipelothrix sp. HDW6A]QIK58221.1 sel1 repeat family protein [Erysipelothrix sp. HDW6A]
MTKPHLVNMNMFLEKGKPFPKKLDPDGKKGLVTTESAIGYSKYTARSNANEKTFEKVDFAPGGYYDYTSKRFGATRTFTNEGWKDSSQDIKQFRNYVAKHFQDDGDILWIPVQSYKDYTTANQYGLFNQEDYAEITKKSLERFFKYVGLEPNNMIWWMNYHNNKNHPHVHLAFLEKDKTRSKGTFTQEELVQYKRFILTEMKERERLILGTENEMIASFKNMDFERQVIKKNALELISSKQSSNINSLIFKLSEELPEKGRLQYGSPHMIPYRDKLDAIVEHILNHEKIRNEYESLKNTWIELDDDYSKTLNEDITNMVDAEDSKLRKQIANLVLKEIKNKTYVIDEYNELSVSKFAHELHNEESELPHHLENDNFNDDEDIKDVESLDGSLETPGHFIEWTDDYKLALSYLYGSKEQERDLLVAREMLAIESQKGNVLATHDLAKTILLLDEENGQETSFDLYQKSLEVFETLRSQNELNRDDPTKEKSYQYMLKYLSYRIGKMHLYGLGNEVDYEKAIRYLSNSDGNKYALYSLGSLYERGLGVEKDKDTAMNYYKEASDRGNPYGSYAYARRVENDNITVSQHYYTQAYTGFKEMLESSNDDQLHYKLGMILIDGKMGHTDIDEGIKHLNEAVIRNNDYAKVQFVKTVEKYELEEKFEQASKLKQELLKKDNQSMLYYEGFKLTKSEDIHELLEGIKYLKRIENHEEEDSVCYRLYKSYLDLDEEQELYYLTLSAGHDNEYALYNLAKYHEDNDNIEMSQSLYNKALNIYLLKANANGSDIFTNKRLGHMFEKGKGIDIDVNKALQYYLSAYDAGDTKSIFDTSRVILQNKMIKSYAFIEQELSSSSFTNDPNALYWRSRIYLDKDSEFYNVDKGIKLLNKASEFSDDPFIKQSADYYQNMKSNNGYSSGVLDSTLSLIKRSAKQNERLLERGREEYLEDGLEKEKRGKSL